MAFQPGMIDQGDVSALAFPWFKKDQAFPSPATRNPSAPLEDVLKRGREFLGEKGPEDETGGSSASRQASQSQQPGAKILTGFTPGAGPQSPQPPNLLSGGAPPEWLQGAPPELLSMLGLGPPGTGGSGAALSSPSSGGGTDWTKFLSGGAGIAKQLFDSLKGTGGAGPAYGAFGGTGVGGFGGGQPAFMADAQVPRGDFDPGFMGSYGFHASTPMDTTAGAAAGFEPVAGASGAGGGKGSAAGPSPSDIIPLLAGLIGFLPGVSPGAKQAAGLVSGLYNTGNQLFGTGTPPNPWTSAATTALNVGRDIMGPGSSADKARATSHDVVRGVADYAGFGIPSVVDSLIQWMGGPSGGSFWNELFGGKSPPGKAKLRKQGYEDIERFNNAIRQSGDQGLIDTFINRAGWEGSGPAWFNASPEQMKPYEAFRQQQVQQPGLGPQGVEALRSLGPAPTSVLEDRAKWATSAPLPSLGGGMTPDDLQAYWLRGGGVGSE